MRRMASVVIAMGLFFSACDRNGEHADSTPDKVADEEAPPAKPAPPIAPAPAGTDLYLDLHAMNHLADHHDGRGLFVDFGTPARFKYTNGNWNSGWGKDIDEDGATVSTFGKTARAFVPLERVDQALEIRVRAKAYTGATLVTYLNGETVSETALTPKQGFREVVVKLPLVEGVAKRARSGDNEIRFRAAGAKAKRAMAIDWMLVAQAHSNEGAQQEPPSERARPKTLTMASEASGTTREAIQLSPGASVSWFVELVEHNTLVFGAAANGGKAGLHVEWNDGAGTTKTLFEETVGARWHDASIDLGEHRGIGRLRISNRGKAVVAVSDARIVREAPEVPPLAAHARNVIVLLIDTLRASKLQQYYPKSRVKTPVIDVFAKEGVVFERPQSPENWTKPSVASILTSLHPATHNTKQESSKLPRSALMLSEIYKKAGFRTSSFIANGYVSNAFGFDQGWDHYTNYIREARSTTAKNVFGEAIDWIEKNKDQRFFAYIQTIDPHVPYDPPDRFLKMYDPEPYNGQIKNRRTHLMLDDAKKNPKKYNFTKRDKERLEALHDGEISYHDEYFGKFLARFKELGLDENTIIVITSDHGEEFQEHGSWGHGHSVYQELLHVPLMFRWKGTLPEDVRIGPVVTTMDIAPTVLEATGLPIPDEFEGRSLMGFLRGAWPTGPYVAFSDFLDNRRVIRGADWKMIVRGSLTHVLFNLEDDYWEKRELTGRENPIAMRYLRIHHGQFLGAPDPKNWLAGSQRAEAKPTLDAENQELTPELCRQLVALGYISDECDALLKN